ncbi:hypothetical protein [Candidatus Williamhamiltonella defendens]|nr:hypothetical protein [Candidatus Hamiltonella defensa]
MGPVLVVAATGQNTFTSNSIPARLSADQFVMNVDAVKQVGVDFMQWAVA